MNHGEPIRIMQVVARMNVGGPAVIVAELMRGIDSKKFQLVLVTGYCAQNEADYLNEVASDIPVIRIPGLGRSISTNRCGRNPKVARAWKKFTTRS